MLVSAIWSGLEFRPSLKNLGTIDTMSYIANERDAAESKFVEIQ
jgi:hypothetical protein